MKNSLVLLAIGLLVGTLGGTALGYFLKPSEHAIPEQGGDPVPLGTLPAEEPVDDRPAQRARGDSIQWHGAGSIDVVGGAREGRQVSG